MASIDVRIADTDAPFSKSVIASRATSMQIVQPMPWVSHSVIRPLAARDFTKQSWLPVVTNAFAAAVAAARAAAPPGAARRTRRPASRRPSAAPAHTTPRAAAVVLPRGPASLAPRAPAPVGRTAAMGTLATAGRDGHRERRQEQKCRHGQKWKLQLAIASGFRRNPVSLGRRRADTGRSASTRSSALPTVRP